MMNKVPVLLQNIEKKFTNKALQIAPTLFPKPCLPPIARALLIYNLFSKSFLSPSNFHLNSQKTLRSRSQDAQLTQGTQSLNPRNKASHTHT